MAEADIILRNTGKVDFDFNFLLEDQHMAPKDILPGQPLVIPSTVKLCNLLLLSLYHIIFYHSLASQLLPYKEK